MAASGGTTKSKPKAKAKVPAKKKTAAPKAAAQPKVKPASRPAPEPASAPADETVFAAGAGIEMPQFEMPQFEMPGLDPAQREALEKLSINLARASLTAQGAIAEAALRQADRPGALSPDPFHVGPAMTEVMTKLAAHPDKLFKAQADLFNRYMDLWTTAARRAGGETVEPSVTAAKGDKRFNAPEWSENPVFDTMKQSYLLTSDWLNTLMDSVEDVDPMTKRRAGFFMKLLTDAFSPSNFLASNPVALKAMVDSGGDSLVKGMEQFAADIERGGGQLAISQSDSSRFKVGENVATAPGKVVWRDKLFELLQFTPTTETQHEIPLLIFPPWINKFYILDLRVENSMIRWLTSQGFTVFVCSWVNPDVSLAGATFDDYLKDGIYLASSKVMEQCGTDRLNTVGYCIGGTLMGAALAHMAATGDKRVNSTTFFAAQHDFSEAGDLLIFTDEAWLGELEQRMDAAGGVLPGAAMADTFNALRANDLVWSFFVNNYLLGKEPAAFDLLFWNGDQTRMPKALHMSYLRKLYGQNALAKGEMVMGGQTLDLGKVMTPLYFQASKEDHIAPSRSVYRSARLFGGPVTFTMAGSGHIAGVVNHPDAKKYNHWTNDKLPATLEEWVAGATEHTGSWWPHWRAWLAEKSGKMIPARDPAKGKLKPLGEAPGEYVKVKS